MTPQADVFFDAEQIRRRIEALGAEIARGYDGEAVCVVGLMKSCLVFMADLIRALPLDLSCYFLQAASFREIAAGEDRTDIIYSSDIPYEGLNILLLDDIVDTGITLSFLLDHIRDHNPRSLKVCVLVDRPGERKVEIHPDWAAFTIDQPLDRFIVGYGLDFDERYRGLPYLGTIPLPASVAASRRANRSLAGSET
jgi:hypoxanthine phosphoribosyltransferase